MSQELEKSEYLLKMELSVAKNMLLESLPYPAMLVDKDRNVIEANKIAEEMGVDVGKKCWASPFAGKNDGICLFCQAHRIQDGSEKPFSSEFKLNNKMWQIWWVPISRFKDIYLHYFIDITEIKKIETELKKKEEIFKVLVEHSKDLITVIGLNMIRIYDGPSVEAVLGYYPYEISGKLFFEIIHEDDIGKINFTDIKENESSNIIVVRMRHKNGNWRFIEMEIRNLLKNPIINGYVVNARDITEKLFAEEENLRITKRMIEAARTSSFGSMGSGVVHELNNPLTVIKGFLDLLLKNVEQNTIDKDFFLKNLDRVLKQVSRMTGVLEQLKYFNRPQNKNIKREIDPLEIVNESVLFFRQQLEDRGITLSINSNTASELLYCNPLDIQTVLKHLISNSRDSFEEYKPLNGQKLISVSVFTSKEKRRVIFEIEDNGCGISDIQKEKLFSPFVTTKDVQKGLGLGLSICRSIIDDYSGDIVVNSRESMGSCFTVSIPLDNKK